MAAWQRLGQVLGREPWRSIWVILGSAIVCYGVERGVLSILRIGTNTPPLNPVAGVALGLMLLYGPSALIGILIAAIWTAKTQGMPWPALLGTSFGNGVAASLGYWFLRRLNISPGLGQVRDVILFILCGTLLPTSLNATISSLSSSFGKVVPLPVLGDYWWSLWRSDSLGILAVTPVMLALNHGRPITLAWGQAPLRHLLQPRHWAFGLWLFAVLLSTWIAITGHSPQLPWLDYLPFFCLAWAVARFGQRGSIISGCLIVGLAAWYTFHGQGLFFARGGNLSNAIAGFQSWSTVILAISLVTGAAIAERQLLIEQLQTQPGSHQHHPAEAAIERLLSEISGRIRQSLNMDDILQQTVEEVRQLLQADRVCLFQATPEGNGFVRAESVIEPWPSILGVEIPSAIVQEMQERYQQQRVQVRDDVQATTVTPFLQQSYAQYQIRSSLTTALGHLDQPFGLLVIHQCDAIRSWQAAEVDLIERLAPQIESAIQQGILYNDLQIHATKMEAEVRDRTEQLRGSMTDFMLRDQARQQLIHAMNHDLRTPVLGMLMVLQKLAMQSGDQISLPKSILDRMLDSSNRQLDLIQGLIDEYADQPDNRFQPNPETLTCHSVIAQALNQLKPVVESHQSQIHNQVSLDLPDIQGDNVYLQRVFENLIVNAIQHNPPQTQVTITAEVLPALAPLDHPTKLLIEVRDNGLGLTVAQQQALFLRPYTRSKFDRRLTGIGLGLFLCNQIIQAHQGELGVNSETQRGAIFWFTLPLAATESPVMADARSPIADQRDASPIGETQPETIQAQ
jgi:signal transduction histidine kinase/integral membrane sensor domain MASE1